MRAISTLCLLFLASLANVLSVSSSLSAVRIDCADDWKTGTPIIDFDNPSPCEDCVNSNEINQKFKDAILLSIKDHTCRHAKYNVQIYGKISFDDPYIISNALFLYFIDAVVAIRIDSPGGYVEPAIQIGKMLYRAGADLIVGNQCYSACVLVVAGAPFRFYSSVNPIMVHRISVDDLPPNVKRDPDSINMYYASTYEVIGRYLSSMDISSELLNLMKSTPATSLFPLSPEDIRKFGLDINNTSYIETTRQRIKDNCGSHSSDMFVEARNYIDSCTSMYFPVHESCLSDLYRQKTIADRIVKECAPADKSLKVPNVE